MELHEAFVYKWINMSTGSFYIGYHKGHKDDGYICSSKSDRFWEDFNNPNFEWVRTILFEGTHDECVREEFKLLSKCDLTNDMVYNNSKGGGIIFNKEVRDKMSKRKLGKKRPPITEETRKRMSEAKLGKTYTLEARMNMSKGMKGRKPWNIGISFSPDVRDKMSISAQKKPRKHLEFFTYCINNHSGILNDQQINILKLYTAGVTISEICKKLNIVNYQIKNSLRSIKTKVNKINPTPYHTQ